MLLNNNEVKFATFAKCLDVLCSMNHTPYIGVNTRDPEYQGIVESADKTTGFIILNISAGAVRNFYMDENGLTFDYTQGGVQNKAFVPTSAIASIFAKEDTQVFQAFPYIKLVTNKGLQESPAPVKVTPKPIKKGWKPRLIKGGKE